MEFHLEMHLVQGHIVAQKAKTPLAILAFQIRVPVGVLAALLPKQFPANVPEKAAE